MNENNKINYFTLLAMRIVCISVIILIPAISIHTDTQCQIVEKGEYNRIQYITEDGMMTPEFIEGHYYVLRNGDTGQENKIEISEEEYDACVVGDVIER